MALQVISLKFTILIAAILIFIFKSNQSDADMLLVFKVHLTLRIVVALGQSLLIAIIKVDPIDNIINDHNAQPIVFPNQMNSLTL